MKVVACGPLPEVLPCRWLKGPRHSERNSLSNKFQNKRFRYGYMPVLSAVNLSSSCTSSADLQTHVHVRKVCVQVCCLAACKFLCWPAFLSHTGFICECASLCAHVQMYTRAHLKSVHALWFVCLCSCAWQTCGVTLEHVVIYVEAGRCRGKTKATRRLLGKWGNGRYRFL